MQPRTDVKFDKKHFERIKRTIRDMSTADRERSLDNGFGTIIPEAVTIQLTNRCNLRCKHCFQWNDEGVFRNMDKCEQNLEIDFDIVEKIYRETSEVSPTMYLWGGETLLYNDWDKLADLTVKYPRRTIICTNGLLIEEKLDSILKMSENLEILISLDGFEKENDDIRGAGVYKKLIHTIDLLLDLQKKGIYKGDVVILKVINEGMINKLYDFIEFFEQKGVASVYLMYPWYFPKETSDNMDKYFDENFSWLKNEDEHKIASWHAYKYGINPNLIDDLLKEVEKINQRIWKIRVRFQPPAEPEEVLDYISGKEIPMQKRTKCLSISNRMNVLPNGKVTPCKLFPEFVTGDLNVESVKETWNNNNIRRCREQITNGLMPVCSKCVLLYLHGR